MTGLSENISDPGSQGTSASLEQSPDQLAAVKLVEKLFSQAKKARERIDEKWIENDKFFRGKQWLEKRPSYRNSEVLNYIFSEVQNVLVLLTDNRPTIECLPEDPSDNEFADIMSKIIESKWDINEWGYTIAEAIIDACRYGTAIGHVPWDPQKLQGLGDFELEALDPFAFFPDPNAYSKVNDKRCGYVILAEPTDVNLVKEEYPDFEDYIKPDLTDFSYAGDDFTSDDDIRYSSPTDNRVKMDLGAKFPNRRPNQILKITAYIRSNEMCENEVGEQYNETTATNEKLYQEQKKYPNGRKIVIANGICLEDGDNPYLEGKFPCATYQDHILPRQMWGLGEVEQLKSPSQITNKLISYILDYLSIMGNPITVVSTDSGLETDNLTNQPGLVVEINPGSTYRREHGVDLPPYIMQTLQYMTDNVMQKLRSTGEVSQGVSPSPNASGYAIEQLQEAAQTKLRGKSRNLEVFLRQIGDLMIDRILQFYTVPRVIRLTNNADASKYFKFHIDEVADESGETQKVATVSQYSQDPTTGAWTEESPRQMPLKSRLDLKMSVGSTLPFAKAQKAITAEKLYTMGIIDAEEFLTQLDYPNKEKIIQRMNERQAQMPPQQGAPNANGSNAAPSPAPGPAAA